MHRLAASLLLATVLLSPASAATPREQLTLAAEAEDTYSQIELLRRILDNEPDDASLQEQLIRLWLQVGDPTMAETAVQAWKNAPAGFQTEIAAEVLFHRDKKPAEAIALLKAFHEKNPAEEPLTRQLVRFLTAQEEHHQIVALLETAPDISRQADLLLARARAKRATGDFAGALADFARVEAADREVALPEKPSFERLQAALPSLQDAAARVAKNPDDFAALVDRAFLLQSVGAQGALVRADLEQAWKAAPESSAARILYARSALAPDRVRAELQVDTRAKEPPRESIQRLLHLDQALVKNPRDAAALAQRAAELNSLPAQYELAIRDADAALAVQPGQATALIEKIFAQIKLGRTEGAAATVLVLEKSHPPPGDLADAYRLLAEGEMAASRLVPALEFATKGLKAQPSAALYRTRAAILLRLDRIAESNADLASAKKLGKK